jgi:hypothetical protein
LTELSETLRRRRLDRKFIQKKIGNELEVGAGSWKNTDTEIGRVEKRLNFDISSSSESES